MSIRQILFEAAWTLDDISHNLLFKTIRDPRQKFGIKFYLQFYACDTGNIFIRSIVEFALRLMLLVFFFVIDKISMN